MLPCALLILAAAAHSPAEPPREPPEQLFKARRYQELRLQAEARLREDPGDHEALFFSGMVALEQDRDPDRAIPLVERAVALAPEVGVYHSGLGGALGIRALRSGLIDMLRYGLRVRGELVRGVELAPRSVPARTALGLFYLLAPGIAGGSVDHARLQGIELRRIDAHAGELLLGQVDEKEDHPAKAELRYRKSLAAATDVPERADSDIRLGYLLLHQHRLAEAMPYFEDAAQVLPQEPNTHDSLAEAQLEAGEVELALRSYRRALEVNPAFEFSMFGLARALESRGEPGEACAWYERYLGRIRFGSGADDARGRVCRLLHR